MIKLQLINADILDDTDTRHGSFGRALIAVIIREWII